ncbi:MAG TPA: hypothetical protein VNH83_30285, partial [Bryobacteraceae bacterium]|nr:hypothetical protein [Bryobacteraceae bacterium]
LRSAIRALDDSILKLWHHHRSRGPTQAAFSRNYSISRRLFFLFLLRASACLTRFFSPGFK